MTSKRHISRLPIVLLCSAAALSACGRVADVGQPPRMTEPRTTEEFQAMTEPPILFPDAPVRADAQASLWTGKPMSLPASVLRRIAEDRPHDLSRYLDEVRLDRFGAAFADEIAQAQQD